jgi:transposase
MARFDLSDVEWALIRPLLPNKPRGVARVNDRRVLNGNLLRAADRFALARSAGALRAVYDGL